MRKVASLLVCALASVAVVALANDALSSQILGFGAESLGGAGGRVLTVTRSDDDPLEPAPGSLRWALIQPGPRVVKFAVHGDILLNGSIHIFAPYLTLDGSDAPGEGVCIRHGSLMFHNTHDVIVRYVRIRLGQEAADRQKRYEHTARPRHPAGLECVGLDNCTRVVFDHCSLSWSCKEIFDINHSREVTLQWCILSEPLAGPSLHPYGDDHSCPINASAGTLSVHHCLMEHFVFRGPQFECNDMQRKDHFTVQMEALNNVIADFEESGSRYSVGVEKGSGVGDGKSFRFQFINNLYLAAHRRTPPIQAITNHGVTEDVLIHVSGNIQRYPGKRLGLVLWPPSMVKVVELEKDVIPPFWGPEDEPLKLDTKLSDQRLFSTSATEQLEPVDVAAARVLREAGCSNYRDEHDRQMVEDVIERKFGKIMRPEDPPPPRK